MVKYCGRWYNIRRYNELFQSVREESVCWQTNFWEDILKGGCPQTKEMQNLGRRIRKLWYKLVC